MKKNIATSLIILSLFSICGSKCIAQESEIKPKINIELSITPQTVSQGDMPKFKIKFKNNSEKEIKVLNFWSRRDLHNSHSEIHIFKDGKEVDYLVAMSDPGPISENDYISIGPYKSIEFFLTTGEQFYEPLPQGEYSVYAKIRTYLFRFEKVHLQSNYATFYVEN